MSIIGGLSGLRLPETLHYRLPQTVEEGEEFGKDWTCQDCIRCIPLKYYLHLYKRQYYFIHHLCVFVSGHHQVLHRMKI